jgi:hypothetical protein
LELQYHKVYYNLLAFQRRAIVTVRTEKLTPQIHWGALTEPTDIAMIVNTEQYSPCACCEGTWGSEVMSPLILNLGSKER